VSVSETSNAALRSVILRAADDRHVRRFMRKYGMRLGAARFVAGETLDECVVVLRRLADQGLHTNTTLIGESVRDAAEAEAVAEEYGRILERIHAEQLPCNVALKLTHLGLELDEELAYANVERVVQVAVSTWSSRACSTPRSASTGGSARPGTRGSAPCSSRTCSAPRRISRHCCRFARTSAS
jgi:hypothetical protein